MLPRNSRGSGTQSRRALTPRWVAQLWRVLAFAVVMALGLSGCSGENTPSPTPPVRPPQAAAAKVEAPPPAPKPTAPPYVYEAKGRRDPFRPLIARRVAEAKPRPKTGLAALEVNELKLAGIVWERRGYFALVEAPNGAGYVLRINDVVGGDARVTKITPQAITFEVGIEARGGPTAPQPARTRVVELKLRKEE